MYRIHITHTHTHTSLGRSLLSTIIIIRVSYRPVTSAPSSAPTHYSNPYSHITKQNREPESFRPVTSAPTHFF